MAKGSTGTGSKVLTLGLCGGAPARPQKAKVTREPVACGGGWAMHPLDLLFCLLIFVIFALFIIVFRIVLHWDVVLL